MKHLKIHLFLILCATCSGQIVKDFAKGEALIVVDQDKEKIVKVIPIVGKFSKERLNGFRDSLFNILTKKDLEGSRLALISFRTQGFSSEKTVQWINPKSFRYGKNKRLDEKLISKVTPLLR